MSRIMGKQAEEPAQKLFEKYLIEKQAVVDISWDCKEPNKAPDRILHCGIKTYAVEITTLIESIPLGEPKARSLQGEKAVHNNIACKIENTAKEKGILRGTYSLGFGRSLLNKNYLEEIATAFALNYIKRTMLDEKAPLETLPSSTDSVRFVASIVKHCSDGAKLSVAYHPISAWEGDCHSEAQRIINDRVESKVEKLTECEFPIVLLLWDSTALIPFAQLQGVKIARSWRDSIAAAYIVNQDWGIFQLWSSIRDWDGSDSMPERSENV